MKLLHNKSYHEQNEKVHHGLKKKYMDLVHKWALKSRTRTELYIMKSEQGT